MKKKLNTKKNSKKKSKAYLKEVDKMARRHMNTFEDVLGIANFACESVQVASCALAECTGFEKFVLMLDAAEKSLSEHVMRIEERICELEKEWDQDKRQGRQWKQMPQ